MAVFLTAIGMEDASDRLKEANHRDIVERGMAAHRANALLTGRILLLIVGALLGLLVLSSVLSPDLIARLLDRQAAEAPNPSIAPTFGSAHQLLLRNLYVMAFFFLIAIPFRHGGVMLAVSWNASVWGVVLPMLATSWSAMG